MGSTHKSSIVEKLEEKLGALKCRSSKLVDSLLDGAIVKTTYENKKGEIDEAKQELEYRISAYKAEIQEAVSYEERIEAFRKILTENQILKVFDRAVFESVIDTVVVGGYDNNSPDSAILTFIFKAGVCDEKEKLTTKVIREKIVVAQKYAASSNVDRDTTHNKLELIPLSVELFNFEQQFKHFVFDKQEKGIQKRIENTCQVRVAISI